MKTLNRILRDSIKDIDDPRCACDVKIPLYDILAVSMSAILSGQEDLRNIIDYAEMNAEALIDRFGLTRIPSEPTFRRVLSLIKPSQLGIACLSLMKQGGLGNGNIIAVDGKAIRSTAKLKALEHGLRVLSAYDVETGTVIGQLEVGEKTNEIPVFQALLPMLEISGRILTADAMHCQRRTCAMVIEGGGDYVFQVKKNQKELYEYIATYMDDYIARQDEDLSSYSSSEKGHGRIEHRTCYITRVDGIFELDSWSGLALFIALDRTTEQNGQASKERSYYISSLLGTAYHLWHIIRDHWKVESMHWMLDVTFHEDACRARDPNLQLNLNLLRKFALTMNRQYLKQLAAAGDKKAANRSVRQQMNRCMSSMDMVVEVLSQVDVETVFAAELSA